MSVYLSVCAVAVLACVYPLMPANGASVPANAQLVGERGERAAPVAVAAQAAATPAGAVRVRRVPSEPRAGTQAGPVCVGAATADLALVAAPTAPGSLRLACGDETLRLASGNDTLTVGTLIADPASAAAAVASDPASTPLPLELPAEWLLGAVLLGLVTISRRSVDQAPRPADAAVPVAAALQRLLRFAGSWFAALAAAVAPGARSAAAATRGAGPVAQPDAESDLLPACPALAATAIPSGAPLNPSEWTATPARRSGVVPCVA
ncbi:MAG: hypothetical protein IPM60_18050 [Rhodospirillales bacterium]|nr:hypothetical protein [Rhodospirillales bacterium]